MRNLKRFYQLSALILAYITMFGLFFIDPLPSGYRHFTVLMQGGLLLCFVLLLTSHSKAFGGEKLKLFDVFTFGVTAFSAVFVSITFVMSFFIMF